MRKLLAAGVVLAAVVVAVARAATVEVATDTFVDPNGKHATIVEPDSFAFGGTIVAAAQSGRYFDGGASGVVFATSTNGGASWTTGPLPGLTTHNVPPGTYDRVTDPSVAYDKKHSTWLVSTLPIDDDPEVVGPAVFVSQSSDGLTWGDPVEAATATGGQDFDKNWIVCDSTVASPFYGRCYLQYDDFGNGNQVHVAYSDDGGDTWTESAMPDFAVLGGQPVVQPNGTVVMPIDDGFESNLYALRSTSGGVTWAAPKRIAALKSHFSDGNIRSGPLPSAELDANGRVYVAWADCRFRKQCSSNDIVFSSSTNGKSWSGIKRIPIDDKNSTVDHFLPGIAVDPATVGSHARVGVVYYYYDNTNCDPNCQLNVGWVSSVDAGKHWTAPVQLAGPMDMDWLPDTSQGRMVGDYMSASYVNGAALPVFVVANAPTGDTDCDAVAAVCDVGLYSVNPALAKGPLRAVVDDPVLSTRGDRPVARSTAR